MPGVSSGGRIELPRRAARMLGHGLLAVFLAFTADARAQDPYLAPMQPDTGLNVFRMEIPGIDSSPGNAVPAPIDARVGAPMPLPSVPFAEESASTPECSGYWIVSTHLSRQSFIEGTPSFRPTVTRYNECEGFRGTDFSEICRCLRPGVPVCIMVHGSFVGWDDICHESRCTWNWLRSASGGQPMQMIYLTWPSDRPLASALVPVDVNLLGRQAGRNGFYLADLIRHIPMECPICLIGHSHGTRVISSALHLMGGGRVQQLTHPSSRSAGRRIRTVFAASAIDHDWLNPGHRYGRALCSTECLLNLHNPRDPALHVYPMRCLFSSYALGARGFSSRDRYRLQNWSGKVFDYDVSGHMGYTHLWPGYYNDQRLAMLIRNYVYFTDAVPMSADAFALAP